MSSAARNLEAITRAMEQHDRNCEYPLLEVRLCPFEVERLGWDEIRGVPIVEDPKLGTGRFRLVCEQDEIGSSAAELREMVGA